MKNKELGRWLSHFLKYITENRKRFFWRDSDIDNLEELKALIQQSGEKPESITCPSCGRAWNMKKHSACQCGAVKMFFNENIELPKNPEIDKKFIEKWRGILDKDLEKFIEDKARDIALESDFGHYMFSHKMKVFRRIIRQIVAEVRKAKITDDLLDDIIDVFIEHADCHHTVSRETNIAPLSSAEYSLKSEMIVKEKLRKILNKGG